MEEVRSFIAIELPEEIRAMLARLIGRLKSDGETAARWIDPNGIHLTLKFLGNVPAGRIPEITEAMALATEGIPPFFLETTELGVFPSLSRIQVIWVGIGGQVDRLKQLQQRMESSLDVIGFPPEDRAFSPHLTLARTRQYASPEERQELARLLARVKASETSRFTVEQLSLMRSQLTRAGAIYSRMAEVKLKP